MYIYCYTLCSLLLSRVYERTCIIILHYTTGLLPTKCTIYTFITLIKYLKTSLYFFMLYCEKLQLSCILIGKAY